jgi:site-specific DNA-cytosine methylase
LWYAMLGIIDTLRPVWAIIENPTGAATWSRKIEGCLEAIGYAVSRQPASSWAVGGLDSRRRMFWIANRDGQRLEVTRLQEPPAFDSIEGGAVDGNHWCQTIGRVCRVADGVPGGLDRRKRIERVGLAVNPLVAKWVGERILELRR